MTLSKREWVSNRLTDDQFPIKKEEAANLGLQALAGIVDGMILLKAEPFGNLTTKQVWVINQSCLDPVLFYLILFDQTPFLCLS